VARRRKPRPRGWYEKQGDPPGTERFWDGENWGPNPRYKRGAEPARSKPADEAEVAVAIPAGQSTVWARISARSADVLLLMLPWYWLFVQGFSSETVPGPDPGTTQTITSTNVAYLWAAAALVFVYDAGFTATWGATPGKRLVGLVVADRDRGTSPPGWGRALMRAAPLLLLVAVLLIPILWLACVASMAIDKRKRSVFDFSGATVVVPDPQRRGWLNRIART
jgi:uncharacterized RDD family membrane protein YckC